MGHGAAGELACARLMLFSSVDVCLLRHAIWLLCRAGLPIVHQLPCRLHYLVIHEVERMVEIAIYRGHLLRMRVSACFSGCGCG